MLVYAVIPARSGSKGLPNKNIRPLMGRPLLEYSISFARQLADVSEVICSTDSEKYKSIAESCGANVPFLRTPEAAGDTAMEQDILIDLRRCFAAAKMPEPDIMVWLRPTFVFRSVLDVTAAIDLLKEDRTLSAVRTVCEAERRLYSLTEEQQLRPEFDDNGLSMVRRQDVGLAFKVFSTDVFRFKGNNLGSEFLGSKVAGIKTNKLCGLDIDDVFDFHVVESILKAGIINVDDFCT